MSENQPQGFKRINFFKGFLTTEKDWNDAERYHIDKRRLHNRMMHSPGIVYGYAMDLKGVIPNAKGEGKDYGVTFSALDNKLNVKINRYETAEKGSRAGEILQSPWFHDGPSGARPARILNLQNAKRVEPQMNADRRRWKRHLPRRSS